MFPPLQLVDFVEVEFEEFGARWGADESPGGFVDVDFIGKIAL